MIDEKFTKEERMRRLHKGERSGEIFARAGLPASLIFAGSHFTRGVSEEHMVPEGRRLQGSCWEPILSSSATKVKSGGMPGRTTLTSSCIPPKGRKVEIEEDLERRERK